MENEKSESGGASGQWVIAGGQEERVRKLVGPELPAGWGFSSAVINKNEIRARYGHEESGAEAEMVLGRAKGEFEKINDFSVVFDQSEGAPERDALRDALRESVRLHGQNFPWTWVSAPLPVSSPAPWSGERPVVWEGPAARLASALGTLTAFVLDPVPSAMIDVIELLEAGRYDAALEGLSALDGAGTAHDAAHRPWAVTIEALRFETLRRLGRFQEAQKTLDAALLLGTERAELHLAAAVFYRSLFEADRAAAHARAALRAIDDKAVNGSAGSKSLHADDTLVAVGAQDPAWSVRAEKLSRTDSPGLLCDVAALALEARDFARAEQLFARARALDGSTVSALVGLGRLSAWRGDAAGALALAESALALETESAQALCLRGAAKLLGGDAQGALEDLDRAVHFEPGDGVAMVWRAEALLRLGRYADAVREARRGSERFDDNSGHVAAQFIICLAQIREGTFPGLPEYVVKPAITALERDVAEVETVFAFTPRRELEEVLERSLAKLRGNRTPRPTFVSADGVLTALEVAPSPRLASTRALWRLVVTGSPEPALEVIDGVIAEHPRAAEPYNYRGEVWLYLGRPELAREEFYRALKVYDRSRWAFIGLGAVALLEGRYEEALATLDEGAERSGGHGPTAYAYRGEALWRLGHIEEALRDLTFAVKQQPRRVGAWVCLCLVRLAAGDTAGALDALRAVNTLAPGFVYDASVALGYPRAELSEATMQAIATELLSMLRGNRGASCVTYFTRAGVLRSVPPPR